MEYNELESNLISYGETLMTILEDSINNKIITKDFILELVEENFCKYIRLSVRSMNMLIQHKVAEVIFGKIDKYDFDLHDKLMENLIDEEHRNLFSIFKYRKNPNKVLYLTPYSGFVNMMPKALLQLKQYTIKRKSVLEKTINRNKEIIGKL